MRENSCWWAGLLFVVGLTGSVGAQESAAEEQEKAAAAAAQPQPDVASLGPTVRRYRFTGARTATHVATTVHCSNTGTSTATMQVYLWQFNGTGFYFGSQTVQQNFTRTISFDGDGLGADLYVDDQVVQTPDHVAQGFVEIFTEASAQLICSAQVLHRSSSLPNFVVDLERF